MRITYFKNRYQFNRSNTKNYLKFDRLEIFIILQKLKIYIYIYF
jgi:hypothetical protein